MSSTLEHHKVHELRVQTDTGNFTLSGRPCELSSFSFVPTKRDVPPERTYFNTPTEKKEKEESIIYDRLFKKEEGYNNKLHRDDREHAKSRGLTVNAEETPKDVPTLSSSVYGHKDTGLEKPTREHVRIGLVKSEFYRRNGIRT